ncbi:MAG: tRNA (guanine-N1)-methyltransferase [Archaeoglobales archaeon]|nr:tRNA (guanine-N1)-methyltransferase [Archaeoglobales archaeon]
MRLRELFIEILREKGIKGLGVNFKVSSSDPIGDIALLVARGALNIGKCSNFKDIIPITEKTADACVGRFEDPIISKRDIEEKDPFPFVAIDCRNYDFHREKEKKSLRLQIEQTLGVVRKYMWDEKLIITGQNFGVGRFYERLEDFLNEKNIKKVILLDPYGEEEFRKEKANCYVFGGIVDRGQERAGATSEIGKEIEKAGFDVESRRILLRGDTVGVPDRINHIVEIVLKVVLDGKEIEEAIREVQPPVVARWRLRKELSKLSFRVMVGDKVYRAVKKSDFNNFSWLNLKEADFYKVASEMKFFVLDEIPMKWTEERRCYQVSLNQVLF